MAAWAVHLVNYAPQPAANLKLALGPKWRSAKRARLLAPDGPEQTLEVASGEPPCVVVPKLEIYTIVVI